MNKNLSMRSAPSLPHPKLPKALTGITGFDEITGGGVPQGRPTLVCGDAGCGKSLFAVEFLVRGITEFNEPGVLVTFEESAEDIRKNVASLGFDIDKLVKRKRLVIDHVTVRREEIDENGEYDLEGLFIRIAHAVNTVKAKRVVLDTLETLFSGLSNEAVLRSELQRLFHWLKSQGLTTVITGERGQGQLTRQGLEEYVSDCVVLLDHRVIGQISTRRLRIVKYRGTVHGTNEYPFLIDEEGISVLPITGASMDYAISNERFSTGVTELDEMLGGKGLYRGSSTLLTGTAGTGKTSLALHMAEAACERGERVAFFSFEESPLQLVRNARTIGIHLQKHVDEGRLMFHSARPTASGLELHLVRMHKQVEKLKPSMVILDPISNLATAGSLDESTAILVRLMDYLRKNKISCVFTSLVTGGNSLEATDEGLSSMVDAWLLVRDVELAGERNRVLYVLKARGMAHSNQLREFLITSKGVRLIPAYLGQGGVLTGSARAAQEAREVADVQLAADELERQRLAMEHRRAAVEAQVATLHATLAAEEQDFARIAGVHEAKIKQAVTDRDAMSVRKASNRSIQTKSK